MNPFSSSEPNSAHGFESTPLLALLHTVYELLLTLDREGTCRHCQARSPHELPIPPTQFIGQNFATLLTEETAAAFRQARTVARRLSQPQKFRCVLTGADAQYPCQGYVCDGQNYSYIALRQEPALDRDNSIYSEITDRHIVETTHEGIWQLNAHYHTTFVNRQLAEMLGYTPDAMRGRSLYDFIPSSELAHQKQQQLSRSRGQASHFERHFQHRDGHPVVALVSAIPLLGEDGSFQGTLAMLTDITERQRLEAALRENERKYRELYHDAQVALFELDFENGRIIACNQRCCDLAGFASIETLIGQDVGQLYANIEERDDFRRLLRQQGYLQDYVMQFRNVRTGQTLWGQFNVRLDAERSIARGSLIDITVRRQAEEVLRRERNLFIDGPVMVFTWTALDHHSIDYVSPNVVDFLGYSTPDFVTGKIHYRDLIHPEDRTWTLAEIATLNGSEVDRWEQEYRLARADGSYCWLHDFTVIVRDASDAVIHYHSYITDITIRKQMEAHLRASEARFRSIFELSPLGMGLASVDDWRIVHANPRFCDLLGYSLVELQQLTIVDITHPEDWIIQQDIVSKLHLASKPRDNRQPYYSLRKRYIRKDGALRWVSVTTDLLPRREGEEQLVLGIVEDITERRQTEERIRYLALHDALTGLPNRSLFLDRLQQALLEARREGALLALLFLDLDRFKIINDSLGHAVGDHLLRVVAERLTHHVRSSDTVSRLGGDEFVVILPTLHDASDAARIADKLLLRLAEPLAMDNYTLNLAASIGISLFPTDGGDADTLMKNADMALYQAKDSGRNNYQFFTEDLNLRACERLNLERRLRLALEHGELNLHYQPQIDYNSGRVVAIEALLRWQHSKLGDVPPARFIPIAEDSGLIVPIGEWVLREACRANRAWQDARLIRCPVAVNVSALQLQRPGFSERVAEILEEMGLESRYLELEFTESLLIGKANATALRRLETLGVILAIDDFGTGYSSLNYLRRFAIDKLKIDKSFVHDAVDNPEAAAIVAAIITMARSLRLAVITEGVENEEQVAFLLAQECYLMQGYHFCRPLPAEKFTDFLRTTIRAQSAHDWRL